MHDDERKRVVIDSVGPQVDCGRFSIKRAVPETITATAHAFADGHDQIGVESLCRESRQAEWTSSGDGLTSQLSH
jgi:starch synthase (maltosyl-transferring)